MQSVGLDDRNPRRVIKTMEQCRTALKRQVKVGTVVSEPGPDRALVWRITE
jgi:hypothetical protein